MGRIRLRGRRLGMLLGAAVCLAIGTALLIQAGLPERAAYSGTLLPGELLLAPEIGAVAPPFEAARLDGESLRLLDLRGTPVIVNFWATWCAPCMDEMPELQAFHEAHPGIRLVAVNLGEPQSMVYDWARSYGLTFDVVLDTSGNIANLYRLRGQPSTYVVQPSGVISHIFYGPTTQQALEQALALS